MHFSKILAIMGTCLHTVAANSSSDLHTVNTHMAADEPPFIFDEEFKGHKYHFEVLLPDVEPMIGRILLDRTKDVRNDRPNPSRLGPGECTDPKWTCSWDANLGWCNLDKDNAKEIDTHELADAMVWAINLCRCDQWWLGWGSCRTNGRVTRDDKMQFHFERQDC